MGEEIALFGAKFNRSLRIEGRPERLTAEAGAVVLREVIERLGIVPWMVWRLVDTRNQDLITHPLSELLRTSVLLLGQGWRDQDDADRLRDDAVLRLAVSDRKGVGPLEKRSRIEGEPLDRNPEVPDGLASQPTLSRLMAMLSRSDSRQVLRCGLLETAARRNRLARRGHRFRHLTVDVDSLPVEVYGHQPGSAHNGHYHARIYHPLVASVAETGDLLDVVLREGNAHTAQGGVDFVLPLLDEVQRKLCQVAAVRIDAGFPEEELLSGLEKRGTPYVARIRNNAVLDAMAAPYLRRPPGRRPTEPRTWCYEMTYRAEPWSRERRVVLVVMERCDELFLHHFWLLTSWSEAEKDGLSLLDAYRIRGTAEGHMGEFMDVLDPALSCSPRPKTHYRGQPIEEHTSPRDAFADNEVRLLLAALAYNVVHAARVLMEIVTRQGWGLRRFQEIVLRVAGRVLVHGRRAILVLGQTTADLWRKLWLRLVRLQYAPT
jgi:hypothetical protein